MSITRNGLPIHVILNSQLDRMDDYDVINRLGDYVALVDAIGKVNEHDVRNFSRGQQQSYEYLVDVYHAEAVARGLL